MEKRDDEWRIVHRVATIDWLREYADTADLEYGFWGIPFTPAGIGPTTSATSSSGRSLPDAGPWPRLASSRERASL